MEFKVKYLIGYPGWDSKKNVTVVIAKDAMRIAEPYTKNEIIIKAKDILDVSFDAKSKRSGTRAATGALIGGVLTGGIGLLAGAAIGAQAKDKSELVLLFNEDGRERTVVLQTKDKTNAIFNAIQDAIAYSQEHPIEDKDETKETNKVAEIANLKASLKTETEKLSENSGCMVILAIVIAAIAILA
ncbi:MAG: hypothetical protein IJ724_07225 [Muribaculaceae bacterium]|nr:hypothetical protein [Muribaculaceae bacterium]MBR1726422.1 hypothetical protein [Muribaculaceae bacterium]